MLSCTFFVDCSEKRRIRTAVSRDVGDSTVGGGEKSSRSCFGLFVSGCLQAERNLYSVLGLTLS